MYFTLLVPKDLLYVQDFCFSVARVSILSRIFYFFCIISFNTELKLLFVQQIYPHYYPSISCLLSRCYERVLWTPVLGWKWHMQFFWAIARSGRRHSVLFPIVFGFCSKTACGIPAFKGHYSYKWVSSSFLDPALSHNAIWMVETVLYSLLYM